MYPHNGCRVPAFLDTGQACAGSGQRDRLPFGAICVLDCKPRQFDDGQEALLRLTAPAEWRAVTVFHALSDGEHGRTPLIAKRVAEYL